MKPTIPPADLEALGRLDGCTLANAIETFETRLRNEGFTDGSLRCLFPKFPPMVGHAVTVTIRGTNPPVGARIYLDRTDWWDYIASVPPPRVVVVQDIGAKPGLGALLGEVHVNILRSLECVGAVTNGSVRDVPAVERLGFQFFAGSLSVSHSYVHLVEIGGAVEVGGLKVHSGDLLHGDMHGVQAIPTSIASQVPAVAAKMTAADRALIAICKSPDFSLEKLRAAVARPRP